ncbi:MAG TPA: class I SAM-dependent methyltransferase [Candidatus Binataceae bacterium]|nr:class I SAM-dependent methyltransferase [Candidatus Binataceae bacterium]
MFTKSAAFYDALYSFKNYEAEAAYLRVLIARHQRSEGRRLLDVACGTGTHLVYLQRHFDVQGVDLDANLLAIARAKCPAVEFHQGDMLTFELGRDFDVVTCLFSAIGYVHTPERLNRAVANMTRHLRPGGVLIVEPWLLPDAFEPGGVHSMIVDKPDLTIARMNIHRVENRRSVFDMHYMVGTPDKIETFTERHELFLFTRDEYLASFAAAGLNATWDDKGLMGRGLVIGEKPNN